MEQCALYSFQPCFLPNDHEIFLQVFYGSLFFSGCIFSHFGRRFTPNARNVRAVDEPSCAFLFVQL